MKSDIPKQFLLLHGKPVLMHSIEKFTATIPEIKVIVVLPEGYISYWKDLCRQLGVQVQHSLAKGGETRSDSVKNGLDLIDGDDGVVAIHDAARPLVSSGLIKNCMDYAVKETNAIPVIPVYDTVRIEEGGYSRNIDRKKLKIVQTPQCFHVSVIKKAYRNLDSQEFTDDASVAEAAGYKINLVEGSKINIKITGPEDLLVAEALIQSH